MPCYATVPLLLRWFYIVYAAHNAPAPTIYDIWYSIYQVDEFPRIVKLQNLPKQVGKQCSQGTLGEGEAKRKGTRRPLQWPGRKPRHRQKFAWRKLPSPSATPSTESWPKRCMQSRSPSWPEGWRVDDGLEGHRNWLVLALPQRTAGLPFPAREYCKIVKQVCLCLSPSQSETSVPLPYNCPENKVSYNATIRSQTWRFCLSFPLWSLPPLLGTFESAPAHRSSTKRMVPGKSADAARISIHGMYCDITIITRANLLQRSMRQFIPWSTKRSQHVTTTNTI